MAAGVRAVAHNGPPCRSDRDQAQLSETPLRPVPTWRDLDGTMSRDLSRHGNRQHRPNARDPGVFRPTERGYSAGQGRARGQTQQGRDKLEVDGRQGT